MPRRSFMLTPAVLLLGCFYLCSPISSEELPVPISLGRSLDRLEEIKGYVRADTRRATESEQAEQDPEGKLTPLLCLLFQSALSIAISGRVHRRSLPLRRTAAVSIRPGA